MIQFNDFEQTDWYEFSGASVFDDGNQPQIARYSHFIDGHQIYFTVVISADDDIPSLASISVNAGDEVAVQIFALEGAMPLPAAMALLASGPNVHELTELGFEHVGDL